MLRWMAALGDIVEKLCKGNLLEIERRADLSGKKGYPAGTSNSTSVRLTERSPNCFNGLLYNCGCRR
jgi:hypothetical protein